MLNPLHLCELIRESMDEVGWNLTETAARLLCERGTLLRLLHGHEGVSTSMALALEDIGRAPTITGCRCRRATSLCKRAGSEPMPNGARANGKRDLVLWLHGGIAVPSKCRRASVGVTCSQRHAFPLAAWTERGNLTDPYSGGRQLEQYKLEASNGT